MRNRRSELERNLFRVERLVAAVKTRGPAMIQSQANWQGSKRTDGVGW
jgi:hypothetical protein